MPMITDLLFYIIVYVYIYYLFNLILYKKNELNIKNLTHRTENDNDK